MVEDSDSLNRRKHPRAPLSLLVQYRFASLADFISEYASDISRGGMFIRTSDGHPIDSVIALQFVLADGGKLIEGLGRVAHLKNDGGKTVGMGVEFLNLDSDSEALIERIIEQRASDRR